MTPGSNSTSYKKMNECAKKGGVVILGSNYLADLPINELSTKVGLEINICNRSVKDESITQILASLDDNVIILEPSKVFVNLGEVDLKYPSFDANEFMAKYEWLLYQIHSKTSARLYIVSVISSSPEVKKLNTLLKQKAQESGCVYISLDHALSSKQPQVSVFNSLKPYLRNHKIGFFEAMNS